MGRTADLRPLDEICYQALTDALADLQAYKGEQRFLCSLTERVEA